MCPREEEMHFATSQSLPSEGLALDARSPKALLGDFGPVARLLSASFGLVSPSRALVSRPLDL